MDYSKLSESEIFQALSENNEAIASIRKHQAALAGRKAPPWNTAARKELTDSNDALVVKIKKENRELEAELAERPNRIKRRKLLQSK